MKNKPNILLICSDQHNYRVAGCYGDSVVQTPAMDRLAEEGIVFDGAYCNSPICVASRLSFLSGTYPFETESLGNDSALDPVVPTYAHMAVIGGYHTVLAGRMHLKGPNNSPGFLEKLTGDVRPYETWGGGKQTFPPYSGDLGNMSIPAPLKHTGAGTTDYIDFDRNVTRDVCSWLEKRGKEQNDKAFMMTVGYMAPHCPYIVPEEYFNKYSGRVSVPELPEEYLNNLHPSHQDYRRTIELDSIPQKNLLDAKAAYYGLVDFLDVQLLQIMDTLEQTGLLDDTIIVYFSDHGEMMGEHGRWHKGCFFEDSIRVPMIIRLPDRQHAGKRIEQLVSLVDLFPTVCDWVGITPTHSLSGNSLLPLIDGTADDWQNTVKSEYYEGDCRRMVRSDNWKLIHYSSYDEPELYNLQDDPGELCNLAGIPEYETIQRRLMEKIFADGWNDDVLKKRDERLKRFAYWEWTKQYGEQFSKK